MRIPLASDKRLHHPASILPSPSLIRILPIRQRQRHPRPQALRLVYRHDHFQRRSPVLALEQARTGRSSSMAWINSRTMIKLLWCVRSPAEYCSHSSNSTRSQVPVFLAGDPHALAIDVHLAVGRVAQGDYALTAVRLKTEPTAVEPFWTSPVAIQNARSPHSQKRSTPPPHCRRSSQCARPLPAHPPTSPRAHPA